MNVTTSVTTGEMTFDVRIDGDDDAPAVVLLHGFPQSSASWLPLTGPLVDAGLRTIAPDQRGYSPGARPAEVADYRLAELTGDVVRLCDALALDSVHLVGHDWGAIVAWTVAARHPQRVRSLTAVSVPHPAAFARAIAEDPVQRETSRYMAMLETPGTEDLLMADDAAALRLGFADAVPAELADRHLSLLAQPGAMTAALNWYRAKGRDWEAVEPVRVPTTFVWGSEDIAVVRTATATCVDHVEAEYEFAALDGIGHWVPEQAADVLADRILARAAKH